jgi:conjugative relaxase-like TrwC/TraI family protein
VAWAFAPDNERAMIYQAHIEAAREAVAYIATQVGQARFGDHDRDFERGHIAWLEFTHHTARQTMFDVVDGEVVLRDSGVAGDPDLHTHFLIPNAVFCDSGRVGSLDTASIRGFLFEADAYYHARLTANLREAGFATHLDDKTGAVRITAIPEDVRTLFSKRTQAGEMLARQETKARGESWDDLTTDQREARMKAAVQSRDQKKRGGKDDVANFEDWRRQAKEYAKWEPTTFLGASLGSDLTDEQRIRLAYSTALPVLDAKLQERAVLPHFDARVAAARGLIAAGGGTLSDMDSVTRIMREEGVTQYNESTALIWGKETGNRWMSLTTALHERDENEFIALARRAAADRSTALSPYQVRRGVVLARRADPKLTFEKAHGRAQRAAIERLGTGGKFGVVVAAAGAGKTTSLKPLVAAWREQGRTIYGASLAWRQADDLKDAGIDRRNVKAFSIFIQSVAAGSIKLDRKSVVAIDELGLLGTRQALELLRLREKHGFSIVALGDDKQAQSIEAGSIIDLTRRALGTEQVPEISTTIRQVSDREKEIAGLFRLGEAAKALDMKRADGTAEMPAGGYHEVIKRVATLYRERVEATGKAPTISAPTNVDAHLISEAVRKERRTLGTLGQDVRTIRATDGDRNYAMALAVGDRVRLFKSVGSSAGGSIGRNGSVMEVLAVTRDALTLRNTGTQRVGDVPWDKFGGGSGRVLLAYGDCQTIHTSQGSTTNEHIFALPNGAQAVNGKLGYSASTRHRHQSFLVTSEMAERAAVKESRPINDIHPVTIDDKWAQVAKALSQQPTKDNAVAMIERINKIRRGTVRSLHQVLTPPERGRIGLAVAALRVRAETTIQKEVQRARVAMRV